MIQQNISFTIDCESGGTTTWQIVADTDCVTFSPSSGTVTGTSQTVNVIATFATEDCFGETTITITATDSEGIPTSTQLNFPNPCETLTGTISTQPSNQYPFTFLITASGGTAGYTYLWSWDASILSVAGSSTGSTIHLVPRSGSNLPESTDVEVRITDARGCEEWISYTYSFNRPVAYESRVRVACLDSPVDNITCGSANQVGQLRLEAFPASGRTINWSTLNLNLPDGFCAANQQLFGETGNVMIMSVYALNLDNDDYSGTWSVSDSVGIQSFNANIFISVPECGTVTPVYVEPLYHPLTLAEISDGVVTIDIKNLVHPQLCCDDLGDPDDEVDWKTFTFVATAGQTLNSNIELIATNGQANLQQDQTILYALDSQNCDTDLIQYTVENKNGRKSNTGKLVIDWERLAAPVAVADSLCIECGDTDTVDLLDNDTGEINPSSVEIVGQPSKGTYVVGTDGVLTYTAGVLSEGNDFIQYRVANPDGEYSDPEYLTVEIICTGGPTVAGGNICQIAGIDLESYVPSHATTGGAWSASLSNPSVVSLVDPTNVDFSAATAGTYQFTYEVTGSGGCTSRLDINFTLLDTPTNDECAGAVTLSYPAAAGITHNLYSQQITACTTESAEALPAGWYADYQGDLWFEFTTNAVVDVKVIISGLSYDLGLTNPQVAVYSGACGALVDVGSNSVNDGSRYVELELTGLTPATLYTVRISGSNTGYFTVGLEL